MFITKKTINTDSNIVIVEKVRFRKSQQRRHKKFYNTAKFPSLTDLLRTVTEALPFYTFTALLNTVG